jgi:hypothetical protein
MRGLEAAGNFVERRKKTRAARKMGTSESRRKETRSRREKRENESGSE